MNSANCIISILYTAKTTIGPGTPLDYYKDVDQNQIDLLVQMGLINIKYFPREGDPANEDAYVVASEGFRNLC